jgi:hypothetical protein
LTKESAETFSKAIVNHYWFQMYLDDLPIWAMVGEIVASQEELERLEEVRREKKRGGGWENIMDTFCVSPSCAVCCSVCVCRVCCDGVLSRAVSRVVSSVFVAHSPSVYTHMQVSFLLVSFPLQHTDHEHSPMDADSTFIYTHKRFSVSYNGDQVIEVNLTSEAPKAVKDGAEISMTYSVDWVKTDHPFAMRFNRYLEYSFFEHQIHW